MPSVYSAYTIHDTVCSVWKCTEAEDFFSGSLKLFAAEEEELSKLNSKKRYEWLASRFLLSRITAESGLNPCTKDEYGKPHLKGSPWMISLSHTEGYVACIRSLKSCGTDIQVITQKIEKISPKFISAAEESLIRDGQSLQHRHCIWSAKEAIYKAYGRKSLDFKDHIRIGPFEFRETGFSFSGCIQKEDLIVNYTLFCRQIKNTILVYAIEN